VKYKAVGLVVQGCKASHKAQFSRVLWQIS
jgi:hypothetical protein